MTYSRAEKLSNAIQAWAVSLAVALLLFVSDAYEGPPQLSMFSQVPLKSTGFLPLSVAERECRKRKCRNRPLPGSESQWKQMHLLLSNSYRIAMLWEMATNDLEIYAPATQTMIAFCLSFTLLGDKARSHQECFGRAQPCEDTQPCNMPEDKKIMGSTEHVQVAPASSASKYNHPPNLGFVLRTGVWLLGKLDSSSALFIFSN